MYRIVINKNVTPKTLTRVLDGSIYKSHHWDIVRTKEEMVAYLTQFLPDIISIGPLTDMTSAQVALYLRNLYGQIKLPLPKILIADTENKETVTKVLFNKTS